MAKTRFPFRLIALLIGLVLFLSACESANNGLNQNNPDEPPEDDMKKDPIVTTQEKTINVYTHLDYSSDDAPIPYRIYVPSDYSEEYAYPVLLFLHGAGERGNDNELQLKNVLQTLFDDPESPIYQSIVIVPQCPTDTQWVNTPWAEGSYSVDDVAESQNLKNVLSVLESICNEYSVNRDRIYAMGISMGGFGTWDLLMRHGDIFAAAIPICGGADPSKASVLLDMPIATFHGDADKSVPVSGTREIVAAIRDAGGTNITYEEIAGAGHSIWEYVAAKKELICWLFEQ